MKPILVQITSLLLLSILSGSLNAQVWSVLHPSEDTLHYVNKQNFVLSFTTDSLKTVGLTRTIYPSREIEVDSIDSLNLHPFGEKGHVKGESWLGGHIIETPQNVIFIYHGDSLVLPLKSGSKQSQVKGLTVTVTNTGTSFENLAIGGADSLMSFTITSSDTLNDIGSCLHNSQIVLSKGHGLISYPACFKVYIAGSLEWLFDPERYLRVEQVQQTTFDYPTVESFFDYSPGDELTYSFLRGSYRGTQGHIKYTILKRNLDSANMVSYQVMVIKNLISYTTGWSHSQDTLTWALYGNSFQNGSAPNIFNPLLTGRSATTSGSSPGQRNLSTGYWYKKLSTKYSSDSLTSFRQQKQWVCDSTDNTFKFLGFRPWPITSTVYLKGIGMINSDVKYWYGAEEKIELEYYNINGKTWGQPVTFNISENEIPQFKVYPNPATHTLHIERNEDNPHSSKWIISDLSQRVLLRGELNEIRTAINVETLSRGTYILQIGHQKGVKFVKE